MPGMMENPFAALTVVVAPAMLTNACSVLALGTATRIGRVVDRTRIVIVARGALTKGMPEYHAYSMQLRHLQTRGILLRHALRMFYAALGSFAASALIAVAGTILAASDLQVAFRTAAVIGLGMGAAGVSTLVAGCVQMVRETRLAIQTMAEEVELAETGKLA